MTDAPHHQQRKDDQQNDDHGQQIQVIGAGLGRTGTLSLKAALETLGYKPYHYVDFADAGLWSDLAEGTIGVDALLDSIFPTKERGGDGVGEYNATVENPTCDIYQDLIRRYPGAKVVLTVRGQEGGNDDDDAAAKFEQSWKTLMDTMEVTERGFSWRFPSFYQWIPLFRHLKRVRCFMGTTHLGLEPCELTHGWRRKTHSDGWLADQYKRHNRHVIENVPKEKLLVFSVREGWAPLCQFLDRPVPQMPFPHIRINDSASLKRMRSTFVFMAYAWVPFLALLVLAVLRCLGGHRQSQAFVKSNIKPKSA